MWKFASICRRVLVILPALLLLAAGSLPTAAETPAVITDVRVAVRAEATRFVLEIDRQVEYRVFTLADPYRVVIDLPEVGWRLPARPLPTRIGLLEKLRYGLFKPGNSRIVLDMSGPVDAGGHFFLPPKKGHSFRLVLDIVAATRQAMLEKIRPKQLVPAVTVVRTSRFPLPPRKPERTRTKRVIAIDPGHGGVDPGAIGVSGLYEKNITLNVARALRQQLEQSGRYRVVLTRERDVFIRLRERVAFAREAGAELFISIHADAIRSRNTRGLAVYTLSEKASDQEAAELAERENKADLIAGVDLSNETDETVTGILIDLAQRETMNQSARFAAALVKELRRKTKLLRNSHRFAGFAVLKAPDVPSILVELGFLSNRQDEKALAKKGYRAKLAAAIVRAIDAYFVRVEEASRK